MSAIFLLPVCLTYWPRKYTTRVDRHVDNSHQVWSWYTLRSYSVFASWYVTCPCDLDLWPLEIEQLQCMAGHVTKLATKLEDPMPIRSWFMRYNVSHWLPLKMRMRPLRMRRITWPVSTGSKTITFLESPTPICPSICNFGGSTMNIIKVICENNARPCVKKHMRFCACAKSRDLLKVP